MTPEAPLDIAKGQDEKGKNALSPDLVQGTESLNQYLEPFIERRVKERHAELYSKIEELKDENSKLTEYSKMLVLEHGDLRKEISRLNQENRELKMSRTNPDSSFNYYIDTRKFNGADRNCLIKLWDNFLSLCETKEEERYLINAQSHVVPIYVLIKEWSGFPYKFIGTYDDFCYAWNENVTVRLPSQERQKLLTLKEDSFKAAVNDKRGVGKCGISEWRRRAKEGASAETYERAEKIKNQMKSWGM
jgi:regulator of replication initiation timing